MISSSWSVRTGFVAFTLNSSTEVKIHFDIQVGSNCLPVHSRRPEPPLQDGRNGLLVEAEAYSARHPQDVDGSVFTNNRVEHHSALKASLAGFFRVFR